MRPSNKYPKIKNKTSIIAAKEAVYKARIDGCLGNMGIKPKLIDFFPVQVG